MSRREGGREAGRGVGGVGASERRSVGCVSRWGRLRVKEREKKDTVS